MKLLKRVLRAVLILIVLVPTTAWAFEKPLRVIAPALVPGVHCYAGNICTDNPSRLGEARALYSEAVAYDNAKVGPFPFNPRVVFCSTEACAERFGLKHEARVTVGTAGSIIAPRGWKDYYVRHELIHQRQAEELGWIAAHTKPNWLIEGMAYS